MKSCPCGSNKSYKECCGIYISGKLHAPTPELLMRSRYTAYARGNINYIADTMCGPAAAGFDIERAKRRAGATKWLGLKIIDIPAIVGTVGYVEFEAYYLHQGKKQVLHERSEFHFIEGRWYYVNSLFQGH